MITIQQYILYVRIAKLLENAKLWYLLETSSNNICDQTYSYISESVIKEDNLIMLNIECRAMYSDLKWNEIFPCIYDLAKESIYYSEINKNNDVRMLLYRPIYDLEGNVIKANVIHTEIDFNTDFTYDDYLDYCDQVLSSYGQHSNQHTYDLDTINILLFRIVK